MPGGELDEFVRAFQEAVRPAMERSEPLRRCIRALGALLISEAERAAEGRGVAAAAETEAAPPPPPAPAEIAGPRRVAQAVGQVPLRLGDTDARVTVVGSPEEIAKVHAAASDAEPEHGSYAPPRPIDLDMIAQRSRLKAEACRVFIERRAAVGDDEREAALVERVNALLERAKRLPDCFLWMVYPAREQPPDASLRLIARWYDALAEAAALVCAIDASAAPTRADLEEAMQLLAHADAGLRVVLGPTWLVRPDGDQEEAHLWLRWETKVRQVLVQRHMRLEDPPDPESVESLLGDIAALRDAVDRHARGAIEAERRLKRVRYHAAMLAEGRAMDPSHDWRVIERSLSELLRLGLHPGHDRVLAALDPLVQAGVQAGEDCPQAAEALAHGEHSAGEPSPRVAEPRPWSERVLEVRRLLEGRSIVVIGGEPRQDAIDRMREAFAPGEVEWVRLTEHGSGAAMRAPIMRPETGVVLVLVRFAGHLHVDEAREYARQADKPAVLLQAGYNPEQIAHAVLAQASNELHAAG